MRFERGDAVTSLKVTGDAPRRSGEDRKAGEFLTGTSVTFLPSLKTGPGEGEGTFTAIEFDRKTLEHRLRELAFLNSGVVIRFRDLREAEPFEEVMSYEGGVEAFVRHPGQVQVRHPEDARSRCVASAIRSRSTWLCGGTTVTTSRCCASPTTSPSATGARTWPPSGPP